VTVGRKNGIECGIVEAEEILLHIRDCAAQFSLELAGYLNVSASRLLSRSHPVGAAAVISSVPRHLPETEGFPKNTSDPGPRADLEDNAVVASREYSLGLQGLCTRPGQLRPPELESFTGTVD